MRVLVLAVAALVASSTADAGTGRSPGACAIAWNRAAGPQLRAEVARSGSRTAFIDARVSVGRDTWSVRAGKTTQTSTTSAGCGISFVLPNGSLLLTAGAWVGDTVPHWQRLVPSGRRATVPHNARVRPDGTVGFHG